MKHYLYILGTILLTTYGQLILKWRLSDLQIKLPDNLINKIVYLIKLVFDPFIFSGFVAAFIASLLWIMAVSKLDLSHAYPFTGLTFVLVTGLSILIFHENFSYYKLAGVLIMIMGIFVASRGL